MTKGKLYKIGPNNNHNFDVILKCIKLVNVIL